MSRHKLTHEDRVRGGRRSGEVRRQQKEPGQWQEEYFRLIERDPKGFAQRLHSLTNGAAFVKGLELAHTTRAAALTTKERELQEREEQFADAESRARWLPLYEERLASLSAEIDELKSQRVALRDAIAREAEEAGFELHEEEAPNGAGVA